MRERQADRERERERERETDRQTDRQRQWSFRGLEISWPHTETGSACEDRLRPPAQAGIEPETA